MVSMVTGLEGAHSNPGGKAETITTWWEVRFPERAIVRRGRKWRIVVTAPIPDSDTAREEAAAHAHRVIRQARPNLDVAQEKGLVCLLLPATRTAACNRATLITRRPDYATAALRVVAKGEKVRW